MYKILLDQNKLFECDIKIEGASSENSKARLVLETESFSICFDGKIQNGKVKIPISKLKNILKENKKGNITLEVIAEDTYFTPWKETYETDTYRKVEVEFKDDSLIVEKKKPTVSVVLSENDRHVDNIVTILKKRNIKSKDVYKNPSIMTEAMAIYFKKMGIKSAKESVAKAESILNQLIDKVACLK